MKSEVKGTAMSKRLGNTAVQHVAVLKAAGNCDTLVRVIILFYDIILLDHRRICGPSLTVTSLCGT
jgi:hypothetical protein